MFVRCCCCCLHSQIHTHTHIKNLPRNWAFNVIKTLIMLINQNGILYFIFRVQQIFFFSSVPHSFFFWWFSLCKSWCLRSIWTRNHCVSHFITSSRKPLSPHEVLNTLNGIFECTTLRRNESKIKNGHFSLVFFVTTRESCVQTKMMVETRRMRVWEGIYNEKSEQECVAVESRKKKKWTEGKKCCCKF